MLFYVAVAELGRRRGVAPCRRRRGHPGPGRRLDVPGDERHVENRRRCSGRSIVLPSGLALMSRGRDRVMATLTVCMARCGDVVGGAGVGGGRGRRARGTCARSCESRGLFRRNRRTAREVYRRRARPRPRGSRPSAHRTPCSGELLADACTGARPGDDQQADRPARRPSRAWARSSRRRGRGRATQPSGRPSSCMVLPAAQRSSSMIIDDTVTSPSRRSSRVTMSASVGPLSISLVTICASRWPRRRPAAVVQPAVARVAHRGDDLRPLNSFWRAGSPPGCLRDPVEAR